MFLHANLALYMILIMLLIMLLCYSMTYYISDNIADNDRNVSLDELFSLKRKDNTIL